MSDVDILVTNRAALDEALEIHPFDEESQIDLLLEFIAGQTDLDDEFQAWIFDRALKEKQLHDANIGTAVVYPPRVHVPSCDMDEDCSCQKDCGCCYGEGHAGACCPGFLHCESDTYGFQVDLCDECRHLHPEFNSDVDPTTWDADKVVAAHDKICDCGMGRALANYNSKNAFPQHRYATKTQQIADYARRDAIAMRLKEQGRL